MSQAKRDENFVTSTLLVGSTGETFPWEGDETTGRAYVDIPGAGSGTVTSVSVVSANGFAGSVATATTTPAITLSTTITGILSGNGTAISAASTTGSGAVVLATSPTLVTPALGTPASGTLTNCTGFPTAQLAGLGTGVATALAINVGSAGAFVTFNGALGTPSSGTLTNATGLPISSGVSGLGTNVATALGVNVGTAGSVVVNGGVLGTPSSGTVTNLTGTASININGTVGATTPSTGVFTTLVAGSTTSLLLGTAGSAVGNIGFRNGTSGTITLAPVTGALGTVTLSLPARTDTLVTLAGTETLTNKTLTSPVIGTIGSNTLTLGTGTFTTLTFDAGASDPVITAASGSLTVSTGDFRVTTAGTNSASVLTLAGTQTVTNKRNQPRTASSTTAATLTPDVSSANVYFRTTQTATLTINAPTGTPVIGEVITIYVDSAGAQTLTIDSTYKVFGAAFPATTTAGKTFMMQAQYNGTDWNTTWVNAV